MGRKPGEWTTKKGYSILNGHREEIISRVLAGESLPALAEEFSTAHTNLHRWLKAETDLYSRQVKCVLVECDKTFPYKPGKLACSRLHIKRYNARGKSPGEFVECALPECQKLVFSPRKKFCSKSHNERHLKRVQTGWYERLQVGEPKCEVCGEHRVVDSHHVRHSKGRSDKKGPTVYLCPTHHLALHRQFAVYDENGFRWVGQEIIEGLSRKHPELLIEDRRHRFDW